MTTKINGLDSHAVKTSETSAVSRARAANSGESGTRSQANASGVQITESARQMAALEATIRRLPKVDEAKVAKIRKAIETGSYTIDVEATATKLMVFEHDLDNLVRASK